MNSFNWWVFGAFILTTIFTLGVIYIPFLANLFDFTAISLLELSIAFGLAFLIIPMIEIIKFFQRSRGKEIS